METNSRSQFFSSSKDIAKTSATLSMLPELPTLVNNNSYTTPWAVPIPVQHSSHLVGIILVYCLHPQVRSLASGGGVLLSAIRASGDTYLVAIRYGPNLLGRFSWNGPSCCSLSVATFASFIPSFFFVTHKNPLLVPILPVVSSSLFLLGLRVAQ